MKPFKYHAAGHKKCRQLPLKGMQHIPQTDRQTDRIYTDIHNEPKYLTEEVIR